jgi:ferritin-like metal-binding protein YciE
MAEMLGQPETAGLLNESLHEEERAVEELSDLAEAILTGDSMVKHGR